MGDGDVRFVHQRYADTLPLARYTYRKTFTYGTTPAQNAGPGTGEFNFAAPVAGANPERVYVSFGSPTRVPPLGASRGRMSSPTVLSQTTIELVSHLERGCDMVGDDNIASRRRHSVRFGGY